MRDKEPFVLSRKNRTSIVIPDKLKRYIPLLGMLMFPVMGAIYALINGPRGTVHTLVTPLDTATPFIKEFALFYSVWIAYIYTCVLYFLKKDPKVYYECLVTYALCALSCYAIYLVFQTTVPRPVLVGDDPFTRLIRFMYQRDQPFNAFPSIHCFSSYMVMRALSKSSFKNKLNRLLIYGMSTMIILSTLFIKQHVILDALSAFVLVEVVHYLVVRRSNAGWPYVRKVISQVRGM
jgi:membrane-associated phospholipid phosphatase